MKVSKMKQKVEKGTGHIAEKEKHFQAIFEQAAVGVILVESTTGKFLTANKKYCAIVGYSEEELRNMDFQSITHPDDRKSDSEIMECLISGKIREFSKDKRYIRKNGDVVWVNGTVSPMWKPDEPPSYHITVVQDITEHKQSEEKLRESEEKFKSIFDNALDGILVGDIETKKNLFGNKMICRMLGFEEDEIKNTSVSDLHPEKDLPYVMKLFEKQARQEIELVKDIPMKRKDGSVFYADVNSTPIKLGGKTYMLGIFRDTTQRKLADEAIQKSAKSLKDAQRLAHIGSWEWTVATDTVKWSEELYNINGLDPNSSAPSFAIMSSYYTPQSWKLLSATVVKALQSGDSYELDLDMVRPDGTIIHTSARGEADYAASGKIVGLHGTVQDITMRKRMEEELIQLLKREHEACAEAEAAKKLDRMKSMFIASTSHELRTPLNSIIGFTSLILDGTSGELNPEQKEQLVIVHTCGKHLLALINDIIDLSKIETGRIRVVVSEFNLRQIVEEAATNLNSILNEKKLELKVDVGDIKMRSDRTRTLQCIMNLLSNAMKYTEKGKVEITAKVIDNNVEISVIDTGIGIKTEDIPKLFGPFVRLQSPLTFKTSGTGLGLYLVRKLARDFLGGDVEVKSEFGKGSRFTLRVPLELEGKV